MYDCLDKVSCTPEVGEWIVRRLRLRIEIDIRTVIAARDRVKNEWLGFVESVHLPYVQEHEVINIAACDDAWRERSLACLSKWLRWSAGIEAKKAIMHPPPKRLNGQDVSDYNRLIDGVRRIAAEAEKYDVTICLENLRTPWEGSCPDTPPEQIDRTQFDEYYGQTAETWIRLVQDAERPNVMLCLDTSHAATDAQRMTSLDERVRIVHDYLDAGDQIAHVHWNDNYLMDNRGRLDQHRGRHLPLGRGSIPAEVHRRVQALQATKHLERPLDPSGLVAELGFIASL